MIFNDLKFLFLFLPLTLLLVLGLSPRNWRETLLLAISLMFYGVTGIEHVIVLAGCVLWVWIFTAPQAIRQSRLRLTLAIAGPLLTLLYYKYLGFVLRDVLGIEPAQGLLADIGDKLLPAGISFFTFHLVAFAIDRFRGDIGRQPPFQHFMLYITFFPHLVAGPILRYHEVAEAIGNLPRFRPQRADWQPAIRYFVAGLAAKVLIADGLAAYINPLIADIDGLSSPQALYVVFAYSFQIYFDFWGYSLMAIGLAFMFGFRFPINFDRPYEANNPRDFWRRWHMTLGRWFRDYLYLPLGGNHSYIRNILIVFAICGLWHGAAWQFMIWGIYHGLLIVAYHMSRQVWDRWPVLLQRGVTFIAVSFGWVLFLFDFHTAMRFLGRLGDTGLQLQAIPAGGWLMLGLAAFACFGIDIGRIIATPETARSGGAVRTAAYALLLTAAILFIDRSNSFIYFRF